MKDLYPHNKEAYEAVMKAFETKNRAAIVHATGTGKSYVIAAVVEHFSNPLVIAPNNFVLNETRKVCKKGTDFRTYASVMCDEEGSTYGYDIIVLDEFHRSGADKWGIGVRRLLEANPTAKVLGTSATHIRYLDNERNMADEMFYGNIVSSLPLKEAIDKGILPNPTYVSSLYSLSEDVAKYKRKIKSSRHSAEEKTELLERLQGLSNNWDNALGVPHIIHKYFDRNMQRVIVFCSKISKAAQARKWLGEWFAAAGYKHIRFYNIDYKETRLEKEMADFQEPCEKGQLKIAISVNMLNEGVHIPRVDGIIMLRSTVSRIIIEQQVGRCLTANNLGRTPVVLDLVNNMDTIGKTFLGFKDSEVSGAKTYKEHDDDDGFPFKVIDECRDIRVFFGQMEKLFNALWTMETATNEALRYDSRMAFKRGCYSAYSWAVRHNCIDVVCAHLFKKTHWTKDMVLDIASKYTRKSEFRSENPSAYSAATRLGLLEEIGKFFESDKLTMEEVMEEAKKYNKRCDFMKSSRRHAAWAVRHKCFQEVCAHMPTAHTKNLWTREEVLARAKSFNSLTEFARNGKGLASAAHRLGIYDEVKAIINQQRILWDKDSVMAKAREFRCMTDFARKHDAAVRYAKRHGFYDELLAICPKQRVYWNEALLAEEARKYSTRIAFKKGNNSAYIKAIRLGVLQKICSHMP